MFQNLHLQIRYLVLTIYHRGGFYFIRHNILLEDQKRYYVFFILKYSFEGQLFYKVWKQIQILEKCFDGSSHKNNIWLFVILNWISFTCWKVVARFEVWHGRESVSSRLVFIYYYLFIYIFSGFCATDVIDINISNAKWKEKKSHLTSLSTDCSSDFAFMYRYLNICIWNMFTYSIHYMKLQLK